MVVFFLCIRLVVVVVVVVFKLENIWQYNLHSQ